MTRSETRGYRPTRHLYSVLLGLSRLLNACLAGDPDDSLSGRAGKGREAGSWFWTAVAGCIDALWWPIQRDHCARSIERDEGEAAAVVAGALWLLLWGGFALLLFLLLFAPAASLAEEASPPAAEAARTPDLLWLELKCWPAALGRAALEQKGLTIERVLVDPAGATFEWWSRPDGAVLLVLAHKTPGGLPYRCGLGEQPAGRES